MALEAGDDLACLGGVGDDGEYGHAGSTAKAGHDVQRVDLGQQPGSGLLRESASTS